MQDSKMANPVSGKVFKRREFIKKFVINTEGQRILEIGAFGTPTFFKNETRVEYADRLSKEELVSTLNKDEVKLKTVVDVDYVIKGKNFASSIAKKFDLVVANHVIEHIPDVITWLQNISSVLSDRGHLFLAVPHKEYTFDKIRNTTSLTEIIRNYQENLNYPSVYQIFDCIYYKRPIKVGSDVWSGNYKHLLSKGTFRNAKEAFNAAQLAMKKDMYLSPHCSVFTYQSFLEISNELFNSGYINLQVINSKDVEKPYNEFFVILKKIV